MQLLLQTIAAGAASHLLSCCGSGCCWCSSSAVAAAVAAVQLAGYVLAGRDVNSRVLTEEAKRLQRQARVEQQQAVPTGSNGVKRSVLPLSLSFRKTTHMLVGVSIKQCH